MGDIVNMVDEHILWTVACATIAVACVRVHLNGTLFLSALTAMYLFVFFDQDESGPVLRKDKATSSKRVTFSNEEEEVGPGTISTRAKVSSVLQSPGSRGRLLKALEKEFFPASE